MANLEPGAFFYQPNGKRDDQPVTSQKHYRTEIPNIIDDLGLDPYERALYLHYKRVCGGDNGTCYEAIRTTAERCKISLSKCWRTRNNLEERGLITVSGGGRGQNGTATVSVIDLWQLNSTYYQCKDRPDIDGWTVQELSDWTIDNVSYTNIDSSQEEQKEAECSPEKRNVSDKNNECFSQTNKERTVVKKEPIKKESSPNGEATPPKNKSSPSQESFEMFEALTDLCQIDTELISKGEKDGWFKAAKTMREKGYTPVDVTDFGQWWYKNDWRGKQDQPPTQKQVKAVWGQFLRARNGKRDSNAKPTNSSYRPKSWAETQREKREAAGRQPHPGILPAH